MPRDLLSLDQNPLRQFFVILSILKPLFPSLPKAWDLQDLQTRNHKGPALLFQTISAVRKILLNERPLVETLCIKISRLCPFPTACLHLGQQKTNTSIGCLTSNISWRVSQFQASRGTKKFLAVASANGRLGTDRIKH